MIFKFFTRDFPVKKIIWKKFLKGFLLKIDNHGGRRSIAGIKESFIGNAARARLARV